VKSLVELDLAGAIANIGREGTPARTFFFEHGIEPGMTRAIAERFDLCADLDPGDSHLKLSRTIRVWAFLGLEFLRVFPRGITWQGLPAGMTSVPPAVGPIQSWKDFDAYPWPRLEAVDFSDIEWAERVLRDNMAMWCMTYLFQQVSNLFGFAPMCTLLYEDSDLVGAVIEKVATFYIGVAEAMCDFARCGAINVGDDMGHNTATLIAPGDIRQLFLPWHRRIIDVAHRHGKLAFFHVCGKVDAIMDDLIDTVGIDAKHSTQDVIEPITLSKERWGDRVALLGGVDVDFITSADRKVIQPYVHTIIEKCVPGGGFAFGVGNWVADSIPFENYLTLVKASRAVR
jgi:uroporphyrinogen decarboxylase